MAAYIPVPRDLTQVKDKIVFNMTKRQLICFGMAALLGVPSFFILKQICSISMATMGMMVIMMPMFFFAMYEKNGQPLEVYLGHFIQASFIRPKIRIYQTDNYYAALIRQAAAERQIQEVEKSVQLYKEAVPERKEGDCPSGASVQRGPEKSKENYKERAER